MTCSLLLRSATAASFLALGACGNMGHLSPAEGQSLPPKPLMARSTPTAEELLTPPAYANPDRIDELMKRSAPRQTDRFDLPPPTGQAPALAVEDNDEDDADQAGPVTPQ